MRKERQQLSAALIIGDPRPHARSGRLLHALYADRKMAILAVTEQLRPDDWQGLSAVLRKQTNGRRRF
jgi:hypothetical protein